MLLRAIISKGNPPIFIACSHFPRLDEEMTINSHILRVGPLEDNYILALLQKWIKMSDPRVDLSDKQILVEVTKELHGYPLAARLASNVIVKYSIEQVLTDLSYFKNIRVDIAKQLIGRTRVLLSPEQVKILELLTIADIGLSQYDLSQIAQIEVERLRIIVDELFSDMLVCV